MPRLRRSQAARQRDHAPPVLPALGPAEAIVDAPVADRSGLAPIEFVQTCHRLVGMLLTFAQQDLVADGRTQSMYALARCRGRFLDIDAQPMTRSVFTGNAEDTAILTPDGLGMDEANQIFMDLAGSCVTDPTVQDSRAPPNVIGIRVTNDVWMPTEGVTPEGVKFLRAMPREQQLLLSGAVPLWVAEFLSPGPLWYGRSSHPVQGRWIQPAPLITAAVGDILNIPNSHRGS